MSDIKRKWDRLNDEEKRRVKDELILFFENERNEKIGVIAAEELLNFFLQTVGTTLYNLAITDARKALEHRYDELRYDLDELIEV